MPRPRVLYVDDEEDIRTVAEMSLQLDAELDVKTCGSGPEALALAKIWLPDLILLDFMMPGMDGPETLLRLRAETATSATPVVFITARAQVDELDDLLRLGATGVIPKPFDPMTLASTVREYIAT